MKKLLTVAFGIALLCVSASAKVFDNAEEIVEKFWNTGSYIKIVKDKNNICYYPKSAVCGIDVDEDDIEIATDGYNVWTGKNGDATSFSVKKWDIKTDDDGNIIMVKK